MLKFYLCEGQGHDLVGQRHVAYQSIRVVVLNTSCFHCFSLSPSKLIAEKLPVTYHDLK